MNAVIDLHSELLVDRSKIRNSYLRLWLTIVGKELVKGSPWVAVSKQAAAEYRLPAPLVLTPHCDRAVA